MHHLEEPAELACFSRTELELHLARLALAVMRAAPDAFEPPCALPHETGRESPAMLAEQLLRRTLPEHRAFAEARLLELARCLAGATSSDAHELLSLTTRLPAPQAAPPPGISRR